jgi:hypothetical protein
MHPLRIGALYGLIAAVLVNGIFVINHAYLNSSVWLRILGFVLPVVALYLAGHYAGRHERFQLSTAVTGGLRSTLHGTGAGIVAGLVMVILSQLAIFLNPVLKSLPHDTQFGPGSLVGNGALGAGVDVAVGILSIIGWFVGGLLLGTIGGAFGDGQAHRELKSGKVPTGTAAPSA